MIDTKHTFMNRQNFRSPVIQKSEGPHRHKELLILCNGAIMEHQNACISRRGQWPISLLLEEAICHVKEQDCRKAARPCLVLVRISGFLMVCPWGPGGKAELHAVFTHRDFSEITHHETKGKKKKRLGVKDKTKQKKFCKQSEKMCRKEVRRRKYIEIWEQTMMSMVWLGR